MSSTNPLKDPLVLALVSAIFSALLTLLVMALFYAFEHPRKELSFRVLYSRKVKSHTHTTRLSAVTKPLSLRKRAKVKTGVYELEVKIRNTGRSPLESCDFGAPITITFGPSCSVLAANVSKASPRYLSVSCSHDTRSARVEPALLNSGDWMRVKMLVQDPSFVRVAAHVVGAKRVYNFDDAFGARGLKVGLLGLLMTVAGSIFYSLVGPDPSLTNSAAHGVLPLLPVTPSAIAVFVSLIGGYFVMFAGMNSAVALLFAGWSHVRNRVPVR